MGFDHLDTLLLVLHSLIAPPSKATGPVTCEQQPHPLIPTLAVT